MDRDHLSQNFVGSGLGKKRGKRRGRYASWQLHCETQSKASTTLEIVQREEQFTSNTKPMNNNCITRVNQH